MKLLRALSTICSLALATALVWGQPPLAEKIPAESFAYVGWSGRSLTFDGSLLGQLLAQAEVKAFFAGSEALVADRLDLAEGDRAVLDQLWALGGIAYRHPLALGVADLPPTARDAPPPKLLAVMVVDLQKDREEFERRFQAMLASVRENAAITAAAVGTTPYYRFDSPLGPCGMGFVGDIFFFAIGEQAPERVVALAAGKGRPLAKAPEFLAAMKGIADEGAQAAGYVDVVRLRQVLAARGAAPADTRPAATASLSERLKALGLDRATALAGGASIVDRRIHQKIRLYTPAPHTGLLTGLTGQALTATALASVPADAEVVLAARQDPGAMLDELPAALAALDADTCARCTIALAWARRKLGLDIARDVLAYLGEEWTVISAPSLGGAGTGTVVRASVRDEAKLSAGLDHLDAALDRMLSTPASPGRPARGYRVARTVAGGVTIHYVAAAGQARPIAVAPAWAVHEGRFYLAAFPQVIAAAARADAKGLDQQAPFAALRKRVAPAPSVLLYVNTPRALEHLYGAALLAWTRAANRETARGPVAVPPALLPAMPQLLRYTRPDILTVTADPGGLTVESYESLPGSGAMLALAPVHLAAGKILPRLRQWAERAPLAESVDQLKRLGQACATYAARHRGQFPPDLSALIEQGLLAAPAQDQPAIVYLGAMATVHSPGDLIVAHRAPADRERVVAVLYRDGSVLRVSRERFQQDLARSRTYLQQQGK